MFRKIFVLLAVISFAFAICGPATADAFFIPQLRSAETLGWGSLDLSTGVGIYEDALTVFGNARYGIASPVDISLTVGLMDLDASDDAALLVGSDIQYQIADTDMGKSVDVAIGAVMQYYAYDYSLTTTGKTDITIWSIGGNLIVSKPLQFQNGFRFTPYGRLNLRSDNSSVDYGPLVTPKAVSLGKSSLLNEAQASADDSEFNIGITVGSQFHFTGTFNISAELQIDDQIGAIAALNFFMW